ncbi:MAG: hypothetical protein J6A89_04715 [Clostridia bacterium]|nr:hypothetical protein [Clostridia bacterium]
MVNDNEEKFLKKEINKYMNGIQIPENLEGIIMEDINKVKKDEKKKMSKKTKIIAGVASFVVVAGVVSAVAFKDVILKDNSIPKGEETTTQTPMAIPEDENKVTLGDLNINIEDKDLYTVGFGDMAFIQNGEVYYGYNYTYSSESTDKTVKFKKVEGITDAVAIKSYPLATDPSETIFVITEEGTLYRIDKNDNGVKAEKIWGDYKVAQIISAEGEQNHEYVFVLKDNRKVKIKEQYFDENGEWSEEEIITVEELGIYDNVNITGNKGNKLDSKNLYKEGFEKSAFIINKNVYVSKPETLTTSDGDLGDTIINVKKVNNLSNVKQIIGYSLGTDPSTTFFAINESGEVYTINNSNNSIRVEYMKDYKVDEIVKAEEVGYNQSEHSPVFSFELKLKDGSTAIVYNLKFRSLNSGSIVSKDFVGTWESSEEDMTELKIYEDGTFLMDHYTVSSEIKGTYTVSDTNIEFTNEDGGKWTGEMLAQNGIDHLVINASLEGKEIKLWYKTQRELTGTYNYKSEGKNYYHNANIIVTNQTGSSIDFQLSAVHGTDIEHVNIGEVSGTAKKIEADTYQFEETIDGKIYKITFEFVAHKAFEYITITESYPDNINPYAGHNVYFEGDYDKIS